jgi:hypothetical protein
LRVSLQVRDPMIQVIDSNKKNVRRLCFRLGFIVDWLCICIWE